MMTWPSISVAFQPIFDLRSCRPIGYEALLRGPVRASELFAAARRDGRAAALDALARSRAMAAAREALPPGAPVWLNIHPDSLSDPWTTLSATPMDRPVVWEMPELAESDDALNRFLAALEQAGHSWALDDVGDGHADLARLARYRPAYVKLARWWVVGLAGDPHRQALLRALVSFAHERDMRVVAEGIEQAAELRAVAALGVDAAQGYFLARPAPYAQGLSRAATVELDRRTTAGCWTGGRDSTQALAGAAVG